MLLKGTLAAYAVSFVAVAGLAVAPALADTLFWQGAPGGDWDTASNWYNWDTSATATHVPTSDDSVYVDNHLSTAGMVNISGPGNALSLRVGELGTGVPSGILTGYGELTVADTLLNNGEIVAYGWGQQRTLDLNSAPLVNSVPLVENTVENLPGQTRGWYAFQGGRLELPTLTQGSGRWWWGENPGDDSPDLINSILLSPSGSQLTPIFDIALLANDRNELPAGTTGTIVGLWELQVGTDGQGGEWDGLLDLIIRYDDYSVDVALYNNPDLFPEDLRLYHFADNQWTDITDLDSFGEIFGQIGANGLDAGAFSYLAVGFDIRLEGTTDPTIPEPASLALLMAGMGGLGAYLRRRASR